MQTFLFYGLSVGLLVTFPAINTMYPKFPEFSKFPDKITSQLSLPVVRRSPLAVLVHVHDGFRFRRGRFHVQQLLLVLHVVLLRCHLGETGAVHQLTLEQGQVGL